VHEVFGSGRVLCIISIYLWKRSSMVPSCTITESKQPSQRVTKSSINQSINHLMGNQNLLFRASSCLRRYVKQLISATEAWWQAVRKNNCQIFIATWCKTCCTDPTKWDMGTKMKIYKNSTSLLILFITHQSALNRHGRSWLVLLMCNHKEGLCPSSGDINRLMMIL
jgi:hypothetical protein